MFRRREPMMPQMPDMNTPPYQQGGFYQDNQSQRIFFQLEETNRKLQTQMDSFKIKMSQTLNLMKSCNQR